MTVAMLTAGCRADNERTRERLGSSLTDSSIDTASGTLATRDTTRRAVQSQMRLRVFDENAPDDAGAPPPWAHGRGHGHGHGRGHFKDD